MQALHCMPFPQHEVTVAGLLLPGLWPCSRLPSSGLTPRKGHAVHGLLMPMAVYCSCCPLQRLGVQPRRQCPSTDWGLSQAAAAERLKTEARAALTRSGQLFRTVAQAASEGQPQGVLPLPAQKALLQWCRALCARAALADNFEVGQGSALCQMCVSQLWLPLCSARLHWRCMTPAEGAA